MPLFGRKRRSERPTEPAYRTPPPPPPPKSLVDESAIERVTTAVKEALGRPLYELPETEARERLSAVFGNELTFDSLRQMGRGFVIQESWLLNRLRQDQLWRPEGADREERQRVVRAYRAANPDLDYMRLADLPQQELPRLLRDWAASKLGISIPDQGPIREIEKRLFMMGHPYARAGGVLASGMHYSFDPSFTADVDELVARHAALYAELEASREQLRNGFDEAKLRWQDVDLEVPDGLALLFFGRGHTSSDPWDALSYVVDKRLQMTLREPLRARMELIDTERKAELKVEQQLAEKEKRLERERQADVAWAKLTATPTASLAANSAPEATAAATTAAATASVQPSLSSLSGEQEKEKISARVLAIVGEHPERLSAAEFESRLRQGLESLEVEDLSVHKRSPLSFPGSSHNAAYERLIKANSAQQEKVYLPWQISNEILDGAVPLFSQPESLQEAVAADPTLLEITPRDIEVRPLGRTVGDWLEQKLGKTFPANVKREQREEAKREFNDALAAVHLSWRDLYVDSPEGYARFFDKRPDSFEPEKDIVIVARDRRSSLVLALVEERQRELNQQLTVKGEQERLAVARNRWAELDTTTTAVTETPAVAAEGAVAEAGSVEPDLGR